MVPTTTQTLPRDTWTTYFDTLSKDLGTTIVTIEAVGKDIGDQLAADHLVLTGITYDHKDDILVIGVDAPGGDPEEYEHVVSSPQAISVATGDPDGPPLVIDIEDGEGRHHIVSLELPPELPGE
ncbi:MAG: hypothetical protein JWR30_2331 [Conexibacter sp.]|jgi:hypothetical protein|nr:hypothetical protein [Conexibacter sp.]MDX6717074.1 hypothetical protein [Baekduia sp.]